MSPAPVGGPGIADGRRVQDMAEPSAVADPGAGTGPSSGDDDTPARDGSVRGWRARVRRTPGGRLLLKAGALVVGLAFIALGFALVVLPGPLTIPPILVGLYVLSTEFAWADRLLQRAKASAAEAWEGAKGQARQLRARDRGRARPRRCRAVGRGATTTWSPAAARPSVCRQGMR